MVPPKVPDAFRNVRVLVPRVTVPPVPANVSMDAPAPVEEEISNVPPVVRFTPLEAAMEPAPLSASVLPDAIVVSPQ